MATTPESQPDTDLPQDSLTDGRTPQDGENQVWDSIKQALRPIASLKLTVALFAMSIFIVLTGTLAQVDADIWEVIDKYFRIDRAAIAQDGLTPGALFVWIDSQIFFPPSFVPDGLPNGLDWLANIHFPFPKGWLIGAVMLLNLFAAHLVRFKVQAADFRLAAGLSVIAVGCLMTALVIASGSSTGGFQSEHWISWNALWGMLQVSLLVAGAAALYGGVVLPKGQGVARCGLGVTALALMSALAWTFLDTGDRFSDSSMRILYQLLKATLPGLVLLAGCIIAFRKRAGIVLLHGGIGLMMLSEVLVGLQAEEAQMRIEEGAARNFVEDIRTVELAFVQTLESGEETHTVIPGRMLKQEQPISHDELSVDVEVLRFIQNAEQFTPDETAEEISRIEGLLAEKLTFKDRLEEKYAIKADKIPEFEEDVARIEEEIAELEVLLEDIRNLATLATTGIGLQRIAIPVRASTGTDMGGGVDATAAYVRLTDKESGEDLGTWLVSIDFDWFSLGWNEQTCTAADCDYRIELRFERTYKPYTITLNDIRKEDYIGTDTPRDYSSFVRLQDERSGTDRDDVRIWMNNPLRYGGETFYQSSYYPANAIYRGSGEWTSLQIVKNTGWMIPYVSCMIVAVGMCAQFGLVLWRFLQRRAREQTQAMASVQTLRQETASRKQMQNAQKAAAHRSGQPKQTLDDPPDPDPRDWTRLASDWVLPVTIVLVFAGYLGSKTRIPETESGRMDLRAFGNLPIVYQGRPKPIDTLARNSLLIISDRQEFTGRVDQQTWQENWDEIQQTLLDQWPDLTEDDLEPFEEGDQTLSSLVDVITPVASKANMVSLGFKTTTEGDVVVVHRLISDSPAERSDLQAGDVILKINDIELTHATIPGIGDLVAGAAGTVVRLTVQHEDSDDAEDIELIRDTAGMKRADIADIVYETTSEKQPAIRWLSDVMISPLLEPDAPAHEHRVFRIENLELQATLGLPRRDGFRYSFQEFMERIPDYLEHLSEALEIAEANPEDLTFYQRKVLELNTKLQSYLELISAFDTPSLPPLPTDESFESNPSAALQSLRQTHEFLVFESNRLAQADLPMAIPLQPGAGDDDATAGTGQWLPVPAALLHVYADYASQKRIVYDPYYDGGLPETPLDRDAAETALGFSLILGAYRQRDVDEFNDAVAKYTEQIAANVPDDVDMKKIRFESFFNHSAPFYYAAAVYLFAFLLTCLSWLGPWSQTLNRTAFWLIAFTSLVHVLAIVGRIYISGRPPVTNLYSSAVFIGLASVVLAMLLEWFYRVGVGNIVASISGFITLGIAHFLAGDGDTFTVLQAVLDTQFWLATHVVCITAGYATTYVAGLLGLIYICRRAPLHHLVIQAFLWTIVGWILLPSNMSLHFEMSPLMTRLIVSFLGLSVISAAILIDSRIGFQKLSRTDGKSIIRMIYGALCFSIFFSFVGTVLGGLWADDSWGRFWGWDPKENGALIIVLWNALVLHARWDGMVRERGLAILAVLGNIAVSWSWFGVNELGVGLHSYGFTEGVLLALGVFCASQLAFAAAGCLPEGPRADRQETAST